MKSSDLRLKTIETRNGAWGHIESFIDWKTSENSFSLVSLQQFVNLEHLGFLSRPKDNTIEARVENISGS